MKKKITRIWGVGLIVMLLSGLFVAAAPVSAADPLQWNMEYPPSVVNKILQPGLDIYDFDINGDTVWAVGTDGLSANLTYKSVNGGATWSQINSATTLLGTANATMVAIAPDDPNIVVIVDAVNSTAYVTTSGGAIFSNMNLANATTAVGTIRDVAISPSIFGTRYVALANSKGVHYFNLGAASPSWTNAVNEGLFAFNPLTGGGSFWSIAFSPNFQSDYIALAVSENQSTDLVQLHAISFNSYKWNSAIGYFENYPATVISANTTVRAADIALAPDYMGGDDVLRLSFVGLDATANGAQVGRVFRMNNWLSTALMATATGINSVDYNGTTLVAGAYGTNVTYYSNDPLALAPTVLPSRSYKRIGVDDQGNVAGGNDRVIVKWYGEKLAGAKRGDASAFSISNNSGMTWNDISLIDSALTNINDIYITPDGSKWYVSANDTGEASIYRYDGTWAKVLSDANAPAYILRVAPDDADSVYVAALGGTTLYYSADAGQTRWYSRTAPGAIADVAVESKDVIYVGTGTTVRKSTNQGFTWGPPLYPLQAGSVNTVNSLSENNVVVGGTTGYVGYSTDGGATWTKITSPIYTGATGVQVTASGLASGDAIYAAAEGDDKVSRYIIGTDIVWKDVAATETGNYASTGIALAGGVLYVATANGTDTIIQRNTLPWLTPSPAVFWGTIDGTGYNAAKAPSALKTSSGSTKLWIIDDTTADAIYSYVDTLADTAPGLVAPADGALIPINAQTGANYNITFTWTRPSLATNYNLFIGLDPALTQLVGVGTTPPATIFGTGTNTQSTISVVSTFAFTPGTTYYWAVSASAPIAGARSEVRSFTIQPSAAAVPTIGSPANGATNVGVNPAFSWSPVTGATMYEFQLAVGTNFRVPLYSEQLATTGIRPAIKLDPGTTYFWRVRAIAPVTGDWSTIANFTVAVEAPPPPPPVEIVQTPPPVIEIPPAPPPQEIVIPPAPAPQEIAPAYIWAIIIIGAVLVIAVIVLIVRTRRTV